MHKLFLICAMFLTSIVQAQIYIDNPQVVVMVDNIKQQFKDQGISDRRFDNIDSIRVVSLDYPDVGYWRRTGDRHVIHIHPSAIGDRNIYKLEYILKHEIGHVFLGKEHTTDLLDIMCQFHEPPMSQEAWELMNLKYFAAIRRVSVE